VNGYQWLLMVLGLVLGVSLCLYAFWPRRTPLGVCEGEDWDDGLATKCGRELTSRTGHRVARVQEHNEGGFFSGSATIGLFCKEHCPGDCQNPHEGVQSG
jgi:hypothetical protein